MHSVSTWHAQGLVAWPPHAVRHFLLQLQVLASNILAFPSTSLNWRSRFQHSLTLTAPQVSGQVAQDVPEDLAILNASVAVGSCIPWSQTRSRSNGASNNPMDTGPAGSTFKAAVSMHGYLPVTIMQLCKQAWPGHVAAFHHLPLQLSSNLHI